ncbi:MAG TPA: hypothetical protein VFA92_16345 [Candidatus Binatia bacterium]|nr:hypothetical protein [Candidatus Binatia bacterium]
MPQLVARLSVADGAEDWAARGPRGAELIARRLPVAEANQPTVVDRLRWVQQASSHDLAPLVGAAIRPDGVWALYQRIPALPLPRLLENGPLSPAQVVWAGLALLGALSTLHRVALGQSVRTNSLLIDAQGSARLDGPWLPIDAAVRPLQVREAGRVLCWALGVSDRPGASLSGSERQAPALVATLRSLAVSGVPDAPTARALLVDAAGGLAVGAQLERSRSQLAGAAQAALAASGAPTTWPPAPPAIALPGDGSAGGRAWPAAPSSVPPPPAAPASSGAAASSAPSAPPPPAAPDAPPPADAGTEGPVPPAQGEEPPATRARPIRIGPRMTRESAARARPSPRAAAQGRIRATTLLAAAVIGLVLVFAIFGVMRVIQNRQASPSQGAAQTAPSAKPTATAPPTALPASSGSVQAVRMTLDQAGPCSPGRQCQLRVQVNFPQSAGAQSATWVFQVTDRCTGQTVERPGLTTDKYPVYVYGISSISLPQGKSLQIVAKTTSPAVAGSPPMQVGAAAC